MWSGEEFAREPESRDALKLTAQACKVERVHRLNDTLLSPPGRDR